MKLRSHLLMLIGATLLPMLAFAAVASSIFVEYQRATFRRGATERTLALVTAVDAQLRGIITAIQTLGTSDTLDARDLQAFHAEAVRVLRSQPDWLTIHLATPSGEQVVNTLRPFGQPLGPVQERSSFERALRDRQPAISGLVFGAVTGQHDFAVRVPIVREGAVRYVLSAVIAPRSIAVLLSRQRLPPDWVGVVLDERQLIVARTVAPERSVGQPASDSLRAALAAGPEGWFHGSTIEGSRVYTPYNRSSFSGWTVAIGIPAAAVEAATWRSVAALVAGTLAATAIAAAFALVLSRRIATPVAALAEVAKAIGRGDRPDPPRDTRVEEVGHLAGALAEAAAAVRTREETQGRLAAIVEASSDAIISYSTAGVVQTWNPAATRLFGHTAEEAIGRRVDELLVPPERGQELSQVFADVLAGRDRAIETERLRKDGTRVDVTVHVSPIRNAAGTVTGLMAAIRDITERKRAEEALRAAARAKDEFLAMLGHELRNPLGAIAGAAGVLDRKGAPNAHAQQARAVIGRQVQHLSRLVDDLLDVTRVSSGKVALSLRRLDLAELVTGVLGAWRTSGRLDHHEVSLEVTPAWIDADEARMEQIVANLMGNALKYTPPGGRVVVRVRPEGEVAVLEVADTGVGIPADLIGRVFEAFVQGERALDRSQGGLGLGLSLVKALVDRHDGSVQASSPGPNQGAVFTVRLPRRDPAQPRAVPSTAGAGTTPHRRVLVIEDNEDSREMLSVALQLAGHEVHSAPDGPGGLALIAAVSPDVALIDVGLPGMDGYEVARRIRADRGDDGILLIAITGYGQAEDRRRARAAGFDAHLTKPVAPERLLEAIAAAAAGPAR